MAFVIVHFLIVVGLDSCFFVPRTITYGLQQCNHLVIISHQKTSKPVAIAKTPPVQHKGSTIFHFHTTQQGFYQH